MSCEPLVETGCSTGAGGGVGGGVVVVGGVVVGGGVVVVGGDVVGGGVVVASGGGVSDGSVSPAGNRSDDEGGVVGAGVAEGSEVNDAPSLSALAVAAPPPKLPAASATLHLTPLSDALLGS